MQPNQEVQQPDFDAMPAVSPKPKKHPIRYACRCILVALLIILLLLSLTLTLCVAAIRTNVTPAYVYAFADTLDYPNFPLPASGDPDDGYITIAQLMQENFNAVGFGLTESDIELIFDQFSIPTIFAGTAQDVVSWLLFNGSRPVLDAEEIAATALSGVDDSLMMVLYFLGDPMELISGFLEEPLSTLNTEGFFDALEPVRFCLSQTVFDLTISFALMLGVLLYLLDRCHWKRTCLPLGMASLGAGTAIGVLRLVLHRMIPQRIPVYASYLTTFLAPISRWLKNGALVLLMVGVLLLIIGILAHFDLYKMGKDRYDRIALELQEGDPTMFDPSTNASENASDTDDSDANDPSTSDPPTNDTAETDPIEQAPAENDPTENE